MLYIIYFLQAIFIIRFHFELSRSLNDYSQPLYYLRKVTNPIVKPILSKVPWNVHRYVSLMIAYLIGIIFSLIFVKQAPFFFSIYLLINTWMMVIQYAIVIYVILSFVRLPALMQYYYLLDKFLKPILDPIRRFLPVAYGFDFSPLVIMFGLPFLSHYFLLFVARILGIHG